MEGLEEVIESRLRLAFGACLHVVWKEIVASRNEKEKTSGTGVVLGSDITWPRGRREHSVPTLELPGPSPTSASSLVLGCCAIVTYPACVDLLLVTRKFPSR